MPHFDQTVLQSIPEPALVAVQGRVVCFNPAARELFADLADGAPLPDALPGQAPGAGLVVAGGQNWHFTCAPMGEGVLYLLHAAHLDGMSRAQLDGTVRRLREQLGHLMLSVQLLGQSDSNSAERLPGINRTLCRMLRLVDQLDLLRDLEGGSYRYCPVTLDLAGLCREVCNGSAFLLEQMGVTLRFESPLSSLLINGDSDLLQKLLLELLANSARAAGKGGQLVLSLARRDERAFLSLSGPGRDDGQSLPQLLTGSGAEDRIPQPGQGAGLGLVLIQRVVSLHGGTLMMERRDGINSFVSLPLAKSGSSLPMHTNAHDYTGGFSPELIALSDLLDEDAFSALDLE